MIFIFFFLKVFQSYNISYYINLKCICTCVCMIPVQTSDGANLRLTNVGPVKTSDWYKRRTVQTSDSTNVEPVQTSDQYKHRTKEIFLNFKIFLLKSYFLLLTGLIKRNWVLTNNSNKIFSSLYLCNLVMVLSNWYCLIL